MRRSSMKRRPAKKSSGWFEFFRRRSLLWWIVRGVPIILAIAAIIPIANNAWELARKFTASNPMAAPLRLDVRFEVDCKAGCTRIAPGRWEPRIQRKAVVTDASDVMFMVKEYEVGQVVWPWWDQKLLPKDTELVPACREYSASAIELGVTSRAMDEWIRLETRPLIRITKVDQFEGPVHSFNLVPEGNGFFHEYEVDLTPSGAGNELVARPKEFSKVPDFYTLQPGEQEWFKIDPHCLGPGIFTVQLGITYTYHGGLNVIWSKDEITIISPRRYYDWDLYVSGHGVLRGLKEWNPSAKTWHYASTPTVEMWVIR